MTQVGSAPSGYYCCPRGVGVGGAGSGRTRSSSGRRWRAFSTARSSCGSAPLMTSWGRWITRTSGAQPCTSSLLGCPCRRPPAPRRRPSARCTGRRRPPAPRPPDRGCAWRRAASTRIRTAATWCSLAPWSTSSPSGRWWGAQSRLCPAARRTSLHRPD